MKEKITHFAPAYHRVDEGYGVGGVRAWMTLKGAEGAVSFAFTTGMYLKETYQYWDEKGCTNTHYLKHASGNYSAMAHMGFDVSIHSHKPMYEGQEPSKDDCEWIGGQCYSESTYMLADEWHWVLVKEGGDKVWELMEEYYNEHLTETTHEKE